MLPGDFSRHAPTYRLLQSSVLFVSCQQGRKLSDNQHVAWSQNPWTHVFMTVQAVLLMCNCSSSRAYEDAVKVSSWSEVARSFPRQLPCHVIFTMSWLRSLAVTTHPFNDLGIVLLSNNDSSQVVLNSRELRDHGQHKSSKSWKFLEPQPRRCIAIREHGMVIAEYA